MTSDSIQNEYIALENYPDVLSPKDVARILRICKTTTYKMLRNGEIKSRRVGSKFIIPKKNLIEYLSA